MLPDKLFEIRLSEGKGLGAFAIKDIPVGTLVHSEKPLFVVPVYDPSEQDLEAIYNTLSPSQKHQFSSLRKNNRPFRSKCQAFEYNRFAFCDGPEYDIDADTDFGLFIIMPRFNHSCLPNAATTSSSNYKELQMYAVKPITKGEEISFCYSQEYDYMTATMRHACLLRQWNFICTCVACRADTPFGHASDMRRVLLRGLHYLLTGRDLAISSENGSPLEDSKLCEAMEESQGTLRMVTAYSLLSVYLREAEGLAGSVTAQWWGNASMATFARGKLLPDGNRAIDHRAWLEARTWILNNLETMRTCRPPSHIDIRRSEKNVLLIENAVIL